MVRDRGSQSRTWLGIWTTLTLCVFCEVSFQILCQILLIACSIIIEVCCAIILAPRSSTLAWKIPWLEEPGRLQSMGSLRVRTQLSDFTFTFHFHALEKEMATYSSILAWRIPGTGSLVGCCLWSRTELDTTEVT